MQVNYKIIVSSGTGTTKPSLSTTTIEIIRKIFVKAMSHKSVRDIFKKYQLEKLEATKSCFTGPYCVLHGPSGSFWVNFFWPYRYQPLTHIWYTQTTKLLSMWEIVYKLRAPFWRHLSSFVFQLTALVWSWWLKCSMAACFPSSPPASSCVWTTSSSCAPPRSRCGPTCAWWPAWWSQCSWPTMPS